MGERERVALLRHVLAPRGALPGVVRLGIGDDCAVFEPTTEPFVVSVDTVVEHVHFRRSMLSMQDLGYRATMGALSDLAAMGATAMGVLSALILPEDVDDEALEALAQGQAQACSELGTAVVGGNLARGGELSITTTVLGQVAEPLRRDGACPGHCLCVAGPLGLAAAGLRLLLEAPDRADEEAFRPAVEAWRRPRARMAEGGRLLGRASAAIDVSDGLGLDASRLAEASGCRIVVEARELVCPELAAAAEALGADALSVALGGGEDYALLATVPEGVEVEGFLRIGRCEAGPPGVMVERADGTLAPATDGGWDHFR